MMYLQVKVAFVKTEHAEIPRQYSVQRWCLGGKDRVESCPFLFGTS